MLWLRQQGLLRPGCTLQRRVRSHFGPPFFVLWSRLWEPNHRSFQRKRLLKKQMYISMIHISETITSTVTKQVKSEDKGTDLSSPSFKHHKCHQTNKPTVTMFIFHFKGNIKRKKANHWTFLLGLLKYEMHF